MQHSKLAIWKGNHLSIEGTQKRYLFLSKIVHIKDFPGEGGGRYAVALSVISETACYLVSKKKGHRGILARKKTSPLVHSNLQCLTRIKNLPWGTVLEQYHNKKTFQKKITGKYYACKYIGRFIIVLCKSKQMSLSQSCQLSRIIQRDSRFWTWHFSCSLVRVWNLPDNHQSLPFLQKTQLSDNKMSTILPCLSYFNVHIKRFRINSGMPL